MNEQPNTPGSRLKALSLKRRVPHDAVRRNASLRDAGVTLERYLAFMADEEPINEAAGLALAKFFGLEPDDLRRVLTGTGDRPFLTVNDSAFGNWGTIGEGITRLRVAADLTQMELSARCGIAQAQLSQLERSKGKPRLTTLKKIAAALKIEWEKLIPKAHALHYLDEEQRYEFKDDQKLLDELADVL